MFTFEYVEPYSNGSCHLYTNCMQCLSDSLCGWCEPSRRCLSRIGSNQTDSGEPSDCYLDVDNTTTAFLTLNPPQCINCSNHISCHQCVGDSSCEWLVDEAYCTRRGRYLTFSQNCLECLCRLSNIPVFFFLPTGSLGPFKQWVIARYRVTNDVVVLRV